MIIYLAHLHGLPLALPLHRIQSPESLGTCKPPWTENVNRVIFISCKPESLDHVLGGFAAGAMRANSIGASGHRLFRANIIQNADKMMSSRVDNHYTR
jgi:hypothetical protein